MIVVVGSPSWGGPDRKAPTGLAAEIAMRAAAAGCQVELVGRIGDDQTGDALLVALSRAGVGHVAILRDPARATRVEYLPVAPEDGDLETLDLGGSTVSSNIADDHAHEEATRGPILEAADVAMGLRYLTEFRVLVLLDDLSPEAVAVGVEASEYAGAALVVLVRPSGGVPDGVPGEATILAVPSGDRGDRLAAMVASYAVALESGGPPAAAFNDTVVALGWEEVSP